MTGSLALLVQGMALGLSAASTPGPLQSFLISQTLISGRRSGALIAFAPVVSDMPIVVLTLLILQRFPDWFIAFISVFGGLFALYVSRGIFLTWRQKNRDYEPAVDLNANLSNQSGTELSSKDSLRLFGKAVLMNWLSPGLYMFWAFANGPIVISAFRESQAAGFAFLIGFYSVLTGGLLLIVFLFDQARKFGQKAVNVMLLFSLAIMLGFGFFLIFRGISGIAGFLY